MKVVGNLGGPVQSRLKTTSGLQMTLAEYEHADGGGKVAIMFFARNFLHEF